MNKISVSLDDIMPKGYTGIDYLMFFVWLGIIITMAYLAYSKG